MDEALEKENTLLKGEIAAFETKDKKAVADFEALTLEKTGLETKNTELVEKIAEFEKKEADELIKVRTAQFEAIMIKIPEGKKHTDEQKAELKAMFESDPHSFAAMIAEFEKIPAQDADGTQFSAGSENPDSDMAAVDELKAATGG